MTLLKQFKEFKISTGQLQIYIESTLHEGEMQQAKTCCSTYYNVYIYQSRLLEEFEASKGTMRNGYRKAIPTLSDEISDRFENLLTCQVFKNIVQIVECSKWPKKLKKIIAMVMQT